MAEYNPDDLIGRTFLLPMNEQGERLRATIKRKVIETSKLLDNQHDNAIDNSELASDDLITKFMCMVGQLQWAATLGRYDILAHVMSMSRFRLAPKVGHIERMKRIYGYL